MRPAAAARRAMYTGDDFNYAELIEGDGQRYSHGLLGIFDPIAPAAAAALDRARGGRPRRLPRDPGADRAAVAPDLRGADAVLQGGRRVPGLAQRLPEPLSHGRRHGVGARGILHYADVFRLADAAGLLRDPDLAAARMTAMLVQNGVGLGRRVALWANRRACLYSPRHLSGDFA